MESLQARSSYEVSGCTQGEINYYANFSAIAHKVIIVAYRKYYRLSLLRI